MSAAKSRSGEILHGSFESVPNQAANQGGLGQIRSNGELTSECKYKFWACNKRTSRRIFKPWKIGNEQLTQQAGGVGPAQINEPLVAETELGRLRMSKQIQDSVSFAVMTILLFTVLSLSYTSLTGSPGAGIRYLHLHWIVLREDIAQVLTVKHIYGGRLAALVAISFCLTWVLSRILKALHHKESRAAWLLFTLVILLLLGIACVQDYVFT
jgi:hypothetical protein